MSQFPAMPMWWSDFFAKTDHLNNAEQWAYLKLMAKTWVRNCRPLPDVPGDLARLLNMTTHRWLQIRPRIAPFFDLSGGTWRQLRLEAEYTFVSKRAGVSRRNGKLGGRPVSKKFNGLGNPDVNPELTQTKPTHTQKVSNETFISRAKALSPKPNGFDASSMLQIFAEECSPALRKPTKLTPKRKTLCQARYKDLGGGLDRWRVFCQQVRGSPFLTGNNERGWKADFDWVLNEANFVKTLEGKYDPTDGANGHARVSPEEHEAARLQARREAGLCPDDRC